MVSDSSNGTSQILFIIGRVTGHGTTKPTKATPVVFISRCVGASLVLPRQTMHSSHAHLCLYIQRFATTNLFFCIHLTFFFCKTHPPSFFFQKRVKTMHTQLFIVGVLLLLTQANGQDCSGLSGRDCRAAASCSFNAGVCSSKGGGGGGEGSCPEITSAKDCRSSAKCSFDSSSRTCVNKGSAPTDAPLEGCARQTRKQCRLLPDC